ncbi:hypothetical protein Q3G72_014140 [Acer saccharum]|nr:hypothetical protein Q3G72_014140 [Acer saccharum]
MKPSEVIGRLLAYESRKGPISTPPKKQKGIALKTSKDEKEAKKNDSDEDLALFVKRFKRVMKFGKKDFSSKGRFAPECANHNEKKKGKVMAATWSGSSDDSIEGYKSSDDEELMANLLAFESSHKSKSASEREEMSQKENESSGEESDSSSNSINGFVEKKVLAKYHAEFNDLAIKSTRKIKMLREENLELLSHNDHLSEQVEKFKKMEDKLREELVLSRRNEESLKRELEEVRESMTRLDSSTKKLDHKKEEVLDDDFPLERVVVTPNVGTSNDNNEVTQSLTRVPLLDFNEPLHGLEDSITKRMLLEM